MAQFGLEQINDPHLVKLIFYPDSTEIFSDVGIADGISIVYKNKTKSSDEFEYIYHKGNTVLNAIIKAPGEELMPLNPQDNNVVSKVSNMVKTYNMEYIHDRVLSQKLFGIESRLAE